MERGWGDKRGGIYWKKYDKYWDGFICTVFKVSLSAKSYDINRKGLQQTTVINTFSLFFQRK